VGDRFDRQAWRRIALSALKAFVASVLAVLIANQSDLVNGSWTAAKGVIVSAIIAGLDAILKVIQIYLEQPPPQ
jgi:uncharacterized membrane protein YccC